MTHLGMLCPNCHSEVSSQDQCVFCSPSGPDLDAPLWVRASWVAGTLDQVELNLEGSLERAVVSLGWIHRNLGQQYSHDLYLKGKTRFACNPGFWRAVAVRAECD